MQVITHKDSLEVLFSLDCNSMSDCVRAALELGVDLRFANLSGVELSGIEFNFRDLSRTNFRGSKLTCVTFNHCSMRESMFADVQFDNVRFIYCNLFRSNFASSSVEVGGLGFTWCNLYECYCVNMKGNGTVMPRSWCTCSGIAFSFSNLAFANFKEAELRSSVFDNAHLASTDFDSADLTGACFGNSLTDDDGHTVNFNNAKGTEVIFARQRIVPSVGTEFIGWKKCYLTSGSKTIVKLSIPAEARRSNAFGRKCRAEFVDVLEIEGGELAITRNFGIRTEYQVGQRVIADEWDDNWKCERSNGIHFFLTREEAEVW